MHDVILDPASVGEIALGAHAWDDSDFLDEDEDEEEYETEEDAARNRGITKAAEYLYELDRKTGGKDGFASKPAEPAPANPGKPKPAQSAKAPHERKRAHSRRSKKANRGQGTKSRASPARCQPTSPAEPVKEAPSQR